MAKILITDKLAQEGIDLLNSLDGVEPVVKTGISEDELCEIIGDYEGLIIRSGTKVTAKVLENPGKLKGIARAGVGVDNIDVAEATRKGVIVMNTPGGNTLSAAEHTMALMLALSRNVVPACNSLKAGAWDRKKYMGNQLNGKILGVIGLGRIGMAVAMMAKGFNMRIYGYDPLAAPPDSEKKGVEVVDDLQKIFREADFISVHVPKNDQTLNMIDAEQLKMMKPTVRLINCARGGIINEDALYDALEAKAIGGAGIDVFTSEPPENKRFSDLENCLVTPHLGASTEEAQIEVAVEAAQILSDVVKGGPVKNALNAASTAGTVPGMVSSYAELARRIGKVMSAITAGPVKAVEVMYRGAVADMDVSMATNAFTIGLLEAHFEPPVNMVNVGLLAQERGISIDETKNVSAKDVASSFQAKVVTDKQTRTITGTVFGKDLLRIVGIDGFKIEMTPADTVVIIFNDDKPGVIGAVGTVLGKYGININTMGVGPRPEEGQAILAVSLDKTPDADTVKALSELDFVNAIHVCRLD